MTRDEFIKLLTGLADEGIEVREQLDMQVAPGVPMLDEYGQQIVNDVVQVGDGRLYIERDDNEAEAEQAIIDLLANLDAFLPDIIAALGEHWGMTV